MEKLKKLTLDEKIKLLSGESFWKTQANEKIGLRSLFLSDGPHGLRKQEGSSDHLGLNASIKTTCFPTASHMASTWNGLLLKEVGSALGSEAKATGIDVILGPGVNMKRNPLCGRNFEYFSEDPLLTGVLASNWINGVQSHNIGTSLKHFAANNQETDRMVTNAIIDPRTLHEYYLAGFRKVIKSSNPYTVMCSYNKLNGEQVSTDSYLLTDVLRKNWGYMGLVVSDWGATCDRPRGIKAGMDLEMPGSNGFFNKDIKKAIKNGELSEADIDVAVKRLLDLDAKIINPKRLESIDRDSVFKENAKLALKAAREGGVLLENNGILPLNKSNPIKVIGALADQFRYQGAGSSQVSSVMEMNLLSGLDTYKIDYQYFPGYELLDIEANELEKIAINSIESDDTVIVCMGLTSIFESEGYDREHLRLPQNQLELIKKIKKKCSNIVIVLVGGAPFEMEFTEGISAILHMQLSGQMGGQAAVDLIYGNVNPSGKLAETYPLKLEDVPNNHIYNKPAKFSPYLEGQYCGYRYFNSANKQVKYPFGFGLSYATFEYSNLKVVDKNKDNAIIEYQITNTSEIDGQEISQVYMSLDNPTVHRPLKVLVGFDKTYISANTTALIRTKIDFEPLMIWNDQDSKFDLENGQYTMEVSSNIETPKLVETLNLDGKMMESSNKNWYNTFKNQVTEQDFESEYPNFKDLYTENQLFTIENSINDIKNYSFIANKMFGIIEKETAKNTGGVIDYNNPQFKMLMSSSTGTPLRAMSLFSPKVFSKRFNKLILGQANKKKRKVLKSSRKGKNGKN